MQAFNDSSISGQPATGDNPELNSDLFSVTHDRLERVHAAYASEAAELQELLANLDLCELEQHVPLSSSPGDSLQEAEMACKLGELETSNRNLKSTVDSQRQEIESLKARLEDQAKQESLESKQLQETIDCLRETNRLNDQTIRDLSERVASAAEVERLQNALYESRQQLEANELAFGQEMRIVTERSEEQVGHIERLQKALELSEASALRLESQVVGLETQLSDRVAEMESTIQKLESEKEEVQKSRDDLTCESRQLRLKLEDSRGSWDDQRKIVEQQQLEIVSLNDALESYRTQVEEISQRLLRERANAEEWERRHSVDVKQFGDVAGLLESKCTTLESRVANLDSERTERRKAADELAKQLDGLKRQLAVSETEVRRQSAKFEKLKAGWQAERAELILEQNRVNEVAKAQAIECVEQKKQLENLRLEASVALAVVKRREEHLVFVTCLHQRTEEDLLNQVSRQRVELGRTSQQLASQNSDLEVLNRRHAELVRLHDEICGELRDERFNAAQLRSEFSDREKKLQVNVAALEEENRELVARLCRERESFQKARGNQGRYQDQALAKFRDRNMQWQSECLRLNLLLRQERERRNRTVIESDSAIRSHKRANSKATRLLGLAVQQRDLLLELGIQGTASRLRDLAKTEAHCQNLSALEDQLAKLQDESEINAKVLERSRTDNREMRELLKDKETELRDRRLECQQLWSQIFQWEQDRGRRTSMKQYRAAVAKIRKRYFDVTAELGNVHLELRETQEALQKQESLVFVWQKRTQAQATARRKSEYALRRLLKNQLEEISLRIAATIQRDEKLGRMTQQLNSEQRMRQIERHLADKELRRLKQIIREEQGCSGSTDAIG